MTETTEEKLKNAGVNLAHSLGQLAALTDKRLPNLIKNDDLVNPKNIKIFKTLLTTSLLDIEDIENFYQSKEGEEE